MKFNVADYTNSTAIRTIEFIPQNQMNIQYTSNEKVYTYDVRPTEFVSAEQSYELIQQTVQNRLENLKEGADPDAYSVGRYVNSLIRENLIGLAA